MSSPIEFVRISESVGAEWVILQPHPSRDVSKLQLIRFLGAVADAVSVSVALQIAPEYLGM